MTEAVRTGTLDFLTLLAHDPNTRDLLQRPREFLGNIMLLIVGGIFAAIVFHNPFARAFFAAPPFVLGIASFWLDSRR